MKKLAFLSVFILFSYGYIFGQYPSYSLYPFYLYGTGLNGSMYQIFALYADMDNGVLFEAPLDPNGNKLPISFSWRGSSPSQAALYISPTKKIGIGITDPIGQLHVGKQEAPARTIGSINRLALQPYGHIGGPWLFICRDDTNNAYMDFCYGENQIYTIHHSGNVGIGAIDPTSKLTVAGDIRAREVKVEANAGADFVFAGDYRLRPLPEVEQFIAANKHLPDIAPADSMVQNGVNMGEMQIKLLQKIEELTLYAIEQQRQIKALTEKVEKMEKETRNK